MLHFPQSPTTSGPYETILPMEQNIHKSLAKAPRRKGNQMILRFFFFAPSRLCERIRFLQRSDWSSRWLNWSYWFCWFYWLTNQTNRTNQTHDTGSMPYWLGKPGGSFPISCKRRVMSSSQAYRDRPLRVYPQRSSSVRGISNVSPYLR